MKVMDKPLEEEASTGVRTRRIDGRNILSDIVSGEVFQRGGIWAKMGHGGVCLLDYLG
jgi:hypothetical protein